MGGTVNAITLPEKLEKVLAQLETESDGVRLAAVSAATRILKEHGLRWCQVSVSAGPVSQDRPRGDHDPSDGNPFAGRSWREIATRCSKYTTMIDQWDTDFLAGLGRFQRLSPKRATKLSEFVRRLRAAGYVM
jgi:hypothetical protein